MLGIAPVYHRVLSPNGGIDQSNDLGFVATHKLYVYLLVMPPHIKVCVYARNATVANWNTE